MSTKFFSDGEVHKYFNPYDSPYDAFINYMNVLSDFIIRIDDAVSTRSAGTAPEVKKKPAAKKPAEKTQPVKKPVKTNTVKKKTVK